MLRDFITIFLAMVHENAAEVVKKFKCSLHVYLTDVKAIYGLTHATPPPPHPKKGSGELHYNIFGQAF
jgi:hypothetical protein